MSSINSVLLLGNVGSVEVKEFGETEKRTIVQISIATTSGYKKKNGEWENVTEWHRCILAIPSLAERAKAINKGDVIEVRGAIRTNKWTDKDGNEQSMKEIAVTQYTTHKKAKNTEQELGATHEGAPQGNITDDNDLPFD